MAKNKFIILLSLISSLLIGGCKTPPINKLENSVNFTPLTSYSEKINFYFPEYYDDKNVCYEGDGTVIIFPDNKVALIDGFATGASEQHIAFLKNLGISKIDFLIATHYHGDHIGTFSNIIKEFKVVNFYSCGAPINTNTSKTLVETLEKYKIPQTVLKEGDKLFFTKDCYIDVLWPNLTEEDKYNVMYNPGKTAALINLTSLVFKFNYKDFSILFTGDVYKKGDKAITKKYGDKLKSDILKAPHHGDFYTANNYSFIKAVNPEYAIIMDNRYITTIISNRYKRAGTKLLYRLTPGYIHIETDGDKYSISQSDNYLK